MPRELIVIESSETENSRNSQFISRRLQRNNDAKVIFYSANGLVSPNAKPKAITTYRNTVFFPELEAKYGTEIPMLVCGRDAARLVMGGNPSETSMAGRAYEVRGRLTAFACSYKYSMEEIGIEDLLNTAKSLLAEPLAPAIVTGTLEERLHQILQPGMELVVDVETTGKRLPWYGSKVTLIGLKPVGQLGAVFKPEELTDDVKARIRDKTRRVIGHNLMFDLQHLAYIGLTFPYAHFHDTMIYEKCRGIERDSYGLKFLAKQIYGFPHWDAWFNTQLKQKVKLDEIDWDKLSTYNSGDLWATETFFKDQQRGISTFSLEMDYMQYAFHLIRNGMKVDTTTLNTLIQESGEKLSKLDASIREQYGLGEDFNFNSPVQLLDLLKQYVSGTIKDTGIDTLEQFQDEAPIIKSLVELRDLTKLKGTSLEGLKKHLDCDNLVHTSLTVHGAETGRSSSSAPNLQNTDPRARCVFVPRTAGGRLIHTDLSGIEYRLIAHASRDRRLVKLFQNGEDIHSSAFYQIFGRDPIDKTERKIGKTANFAGAYGCAFPKFSALTGLEGNEGREAFKVVSGMYPGVEAYKKVIVAKLRADGIIKNIFGRTRKFNTATMNDEREAINWIYQSSGHDILKIYCMELCDRLQAAGLSSVLLISEVHDSNTFDCPKEYIEPAKEIVLTLAQNLNPLILKWFGVEMRVPIIADVEVMEHWA